MPACRCRQPGVGAWAALRMPARTNGASIPGDCCPPGRVLVTCVCPRCPRNIRYPVSGRVTRQIKTKQCTRRIGTDASAIGTDVSRAVKRVKRVSCTQTASSYLLWFIELFSSCRSSSQSAYKESVQPATCWPRRKAATCGKSCTCVQSTGRLHFPLRVSPCRAPRDCAPPPSLPPLPAPRPLPLLSQLSRPGLPSTAPSAPPAVTWRHQQRWGSKRALPGCHDLCPPCQHSLHRG